MNQEYSQCKQTVYDLTELRGQNQETAKLWQLVTLLTKQNQLYQNTINQLNQYLNQYISNLLLLGHTLKTQATKVDASSVGSKEVEEVFNRVRGAINVLIEESKKKQAPVFVQKKVLVERTIQVPVEVQRIVQVQKIIQVERLIEVEKPVLVQKIVERIVEKEKVVEVPVIVERIVEKQVDRPIYIQKKVEVVKPMYIERTVQVERPIVVERIIQVQCPVCAKK